MREMLDEKSNDAALRSKFFGERSVAAYPPGDTREWTLPSARLALEKDKKWRQAIVPYQYRPFDTRYLIYRDYMVDWPRRDVMKHFERPNLARSG
jgi:hypothetical protein